MHVCKSLIAFVKFMIRQRGMEVGIVLKIETGFISKINVPCNGCGDYLFRSLALFREGPFRKRCDRT